MTSTILNDPHLAASEIDRVLSGISLTNNPHSFRDSC